MHSDKRCKPVVNVKHRKSAFGMQGGILSCPLHTLSERHHSMPGMMVMLGYPTTAGAIFLYSFLHRKQYPALADNGRSLNQ
jgi:hypothetical protein